jgi:hypothetical protein
MSSKEKNKVETIECLRCIHCKEVFICGGSICTLDYDVQCLMCVGSSNTLTCKDFRDRYAAPTFG